MKKTLVLSCFFLIGLVSCESTKEGFYDESAIQALDNLSETISKLESCSYTLTTQRDSADESFLKVNDVYMRAPNKMHIYVQGDDTRKGYWYNGHALAIFDYNNSVYDSIAAPSNILLAIDSIHTNYGIDFPAADFFYPTLTDDLINNFDTIVFLGNRTIDGIVCKEINALNASLDVYILIEESTNLPKGLEIYHLNENAGENYFATFTNWKINPTLPDLLFEFAPPSGSSKGSLLTKKSK